MVVIAKDLKSLTLEADKMGQGNETRCKGVDQTSSSR